MWVIFVSSWNLGSIATEVHNLVPNIPTSISGSTLLQISDRKRQFVEEYTGTDIGSNSIGITHQDIIVNLTAAQVAKAMQFTGVDADSVRLGDFTIKKGSSSNLVAASKQFQEDAMIQLKLLGRRVTFFRTYG